MNYVQRKATFKLYPGAAQREVLQTWLALHCRAYNTLLEEHRRRYEANEPAFHFAAMCKSLTAWRGDVAALSALNAQSLQVTAKRVALAFDAFFRRCKAGETAGYPRFKSLKRFSGWGYKTYNDGWSLRAKITGKRFTYDRLHLTGIGDIPIRGQARFIGTPKTCELLYRNGTWMLSVTFDVAEHQVMRANGEHAAAFDWGVAQLLTIAEADGTPYGRTVSVDNPKFLKRNLGAIRALQRTISVEESRCKLAMGLAPNAVLAKGQHLVVNAKLRRLYAQLRALHSKLARQRHEFYHQLSARLVAQYAFLGTEALDVAAMVKSPAPIPDAANEGEFLPNGAGAKQGLRRAIHDAAPAKLLAMLDYKAVEAGNRLEQANTRRVKPTQRCHQCGRLTPKALHEREHRCTCGCHSSRDENAAKTLLRWLLEGSGWFTDVSSGTDEGAQKTAPLETPSIAA